jgi:catecholate siderophore receptor
LPRTAGRTFGTKRFTGGFDQPLTDKVAFRLNGMYENSDSFRDFVNLERYGIAPALTIAASKATRISLDYENFHDGRVADRGIPSFNGRPADTDISTFFGNPDDSHVRARVNLASATLDHQAGALNIRNHTLFGDYDRFYQNYVPGAVTADKTQVALSVYNNAPAPKCLTKQTPYPRRPAGFGTPARRRRGRPPVTDNFRNTGYFNNTATSILAPYANPTIYTPVVYRQSLTDADNHVGTNVAGIYLQDQVVLARSLQVIAGVRFNHFDLNYRNNRNEDELRRIDNFAAPRPAGSLQTCGLGLGLWQLQCLVPAQLRGSILFADYHHAAG